MRRYLPWLVLALLILAVRVYWAAGEAMEAVDAEFASVVEPEPSPAKAPPPAISLRRPDAPAKLTPGDGQPTDRVDEPHPAPPSISELPEDAREALFQVAMERIEELADACAQHVPDEGAQVMALVHLDAAGLLEMELSAYEGDGEASWATDEVLPAALVSCLDDTLWDQAWPEWTDGVGFSLTLRLEPDEAADED